MDEGPCFFPRYPPRMPRGFERVDEVIPLRVAADLVEEVIRVEGIDIRHMAANELRAYFGVVPLRESLVRGVRTLLLVLLGAVSLCAAAGDAACDLAHGAGERSERRERSGHGRRAHRGSDAVGRLRRPRSRP